MPRARSGEANHMTRHPDADVVRARELYATGRGLMRVKRELASEGIHVTKATLAGWLDWRNRQSAGGPMRGGA